MEGIGLKHLEILRVEATRNKHLVLFLTCGNNHHHGLGTGCGTIIHRGIGDVHTRKFSHHTLILEDVVKRTL